MGARHKDKSELAGKRFGRLVILDLVPTVPEDNYIRKANVLCDCGTKKTINVSGLFGRTSRTVSCGCKRRERMAGLAKALGLGGKKTHGMSRTKIYGIYKSMIDRCYRSGNIGFHKYGGRGITVCERWRHSFENFFSDMGERPTERHTLERKDNEKGYSPENCRWATYREQHSNTRRNRYITINGVTKCLTEWCRLNGIPRETASRRINVMDWDEARAVTEAVHKKR